MRNPTCRVRRDLAPTPLFLSLTRPILVGGVERELMIPLVTVVLLLAIQLTPASWALAGLFVFGLLPELRRRTKADPQLFAVLKGHLALAGYYPAQGELESPRLARPRSF